jgi:hypothetical protein
MEQTKSNKQIQKPEILNPVLERIRKDSKARAHKYVEGWIVPKGAE